jgi:filamentous hemagglutinin
MKKPIKTLLRNTKQFVVQVFAQLLAVMLIAELFIFTVPVMAAEGITVDNSQTNKPTVDAALNGVALINLSRTDNHGVSHNKFTDYNVNSSGLILNNSTSAGVSQLGGAIYANPNYANGQAASLVINEVTGSRKSNLLGYTEMFGKRADFILANPNGIVCNGAGFINMPRITLSTGTPVFDQGLFRGLNVPGGDISIEGAGLNAQNTDYFAIVTRMASLNGSLWGRDVSIITGTGYYNYNDKVFTQKEDPNGKPLFAIDASALGSIYAGRISLICNEKGVGVRSDSNMLADASSIKIRADGTIELKDLQAAKDIDIATISGEIIQTGDAVAVDDLDYIATGIINRGSLTALQGDVDLTGRLDNQTGSIASGQNINIKTNGTLNNTNGRIILTDTTEGNIKISGLDEINGSGSEIKSSGGIILNMTGDIALTAGTGNIYAMREFILKAGM